MSRSGYTDDFDCETWAMICWRGAVNSAICGKRGQAFLREMLAALDALGSRRLLQGDLEHEGEVCAIGAVGKARNLDMTTIDPYDRDTVAGQFGIAQALAAEIAYKNDEGYDTESPETRFARMRAWVVGNLR